MQFIITLKDGTRTHYTNRYDESDAAWDDVYLSFPNADYIESL